MAERPMETTGRTALWQPGKHTFATARMVSEYAPGQYGWVLSLLFLAWGISSWALVVALWSQVTTRGGKVGLWLLVMAGLGEAMAAVFDITHDLGHSIAQVLGLGGFLIAAVVLSVSLGRT